MTVSDRGEHVLSELLLLQRARCVRPERASVAHMDQLQQRCKQRRPQRSHSSMVQLGVTSGDMRSRVATWLDGPDGGASESTSEGAVLQRLRVGGRARYRWNARNEADTIRRTAASCGNEVVDLWVRTKKHFSEGAGWRYSCILHDMSSSIRPFLVHKTDMDGS